ncbi:hypothetical protein [Nocardia niwae]|uniref:hypothetical protein n=1 Tax=Nocardia niwae TaxID=626084 RepID=UPI00340B6807
MNTLEQTLTETGDCDINGHTVLAARGPVTGFVSVGYGYHRTPDSDADGVWFIRVQLAPIMPAETNSNASHITTITVAGEPIPGEFAYLWLDTAAPAPQRPHSEDTSTHARTVIPQIAGLHRLILEQWHTPQRLDRARIDYARTQISKLDSLREAGLPVAAAEYELWQQRLKRWRGQASETDPDGRSTVEASEVTR